MDIRQYLYATLTDGHGHALDEVCMGTGCSAAEAGAALEALRRAGVPVETAADGRVRCRGMLEALDAERILELLPVPLRGRISALDVVFETASTNQSLIDLQRDKDIDGCVLIAETQGEGHGRRGRPWHSPPGAGLWMSLARRLSMNTGAVPALSLIAGIAVVRALERFGVAGVGLKWPNDIVHDTRKLGGILIESAAQGGGPVDLVAGIGINVHLPDAALAAIDQPATDLNRATGKTISRNELAAAVIEGIHAALDQSAVSPNVPLDLWNQYDIAAGRRAELLTPAGNVRGEVMGVDADGLLIMRVGGELRRFSGGDLSLRLSENEAAG